MLVGYGIRGLGRVLLELGERCTDFANFAMDLANNGLAVIPLGGDDGKVPLIKYGTLTRPPGRGFISKLSQKKQAITIAYASLA